MKTLFAIRRELLPQVFSDTDYQRVAGVCEVLDVPPPENADKEFLLANAADAEIIITSWGTARSDADVVAKAHSLKLLAHAAGSVKPMVSDALWGKGVQVVTGAGAIAYGVAEFCLGLMITVPPRVLWAVQGMRRGVGKTALEVFGGPFNLYGQKVGIIAASFVGRHLIRLLKNFTCEILLYDPYCSAAEASAMGVTKVETLEEIFSQCKIVSLNAPTTEETKHMIRGSHFALLPEGAVFINTARGVIIQEDEMIEELRKGKFVACLDVTDPEPPRLDSPLRTLPNVLLTPHQAGGTRENRLRIGKFMADEIEAFVNAEPLKFEVTRDKLSVIA